MRFRLSLYHPIVLRDILHSRYEVIRKLAYGQFSTVWLTRDLK
jgi:serine/threonine-protein kinase SRPK3